MIIQEQGLERSYLKAEWHMRTTVSLIGLASVLVLATPAEAETTWEKETRRLCVSLTQEACWVKAGAALCDKDQMQCERLPDQAPARILGKAGSRWHVQTPYGTGWISARMIMMDSRYMLESSQREFYSNTMPR
jgi:hypothetical protein